MNLDNHYKDKICVVTGAASGIGRATAIRLANAGAILAISDINEDDLHETAKLAGLEKSNQVLIDKLDVADGDSIAAYACLLYTSPSPRD